MCPWWTAAGLYGCQACGSTSTAACGHFCWPWGVEDRMPYLLVCARTAVPWDIRRRAGVPVGAEVWERSATEYDFTVPVVFNQVLAQWCCVC